MAFLCNPGEMGRWADLARGGVSICDFDVSGGSRSQLRLGWWFVSPFNEEGLGVRWGVNGVHCNLAGMGGFASSRDLIDVYIAIRWDGGLGRFRLEWCFNFAIQ